MAILGRRFVNIVAAGKYKPGLLSVHRLDVSKHLFYPSASEARFIGGGGVDGEAAPRPRPAKTETLHKLPAPCAIFPDATTTAAAPAHYTTRSTASFSLVSSPCSEGSCRILFINEAGDSKMYYADEHGCPTGRTHAVPSLEEFAGPVAASVNVVAGGGEESLYVMHGVRDRVAPCFHVLRFGSSHGGEGWYWQSLPPPPFVCDDDEPDCVINAYTVVDGGRTICVSSDPAEAQAETGTWCFDTVRGEWWHAGDWELPFEGRAEYLADLDLWLGLSSTAVGVKGITCTYEYGGMCTTSGLSLSAMAKNQPPTLLQRLYRPPEDWMMTAYAKMAKLINLGSGRFAIAKVLDMVDGFSSDYYGDEMPTVGHHLVLTGVEIRPRQPRDSCHIWSCSDGLEWIPHKSISYTCYNHRIHQVL